MATIQGIYLALFGRPADPAGLAYYNGVTNNGADLSGIGNLAGQKEYTDRFAGMGTTQIVQSIYQSLFGRAGEQVGVDFWVGQLARGALSINTIAIAILDGATGTDKVAVDAKLAAASLFTSHLDLPAEQSAYNAATLASVRDYLTAIDATHLASAADIDALIVKLAASAGQAPAGGADAGGGGGSPPVVVQPVSLTVLDADHVSPASPDPVKRTTSADDKVTVSDAYHAVGTIDGGAGHDTLAISPNADVTPDASSITNIERLDITSSANDVHIDLKNIEGLQEIWRTASANDLTVNGLGKSVTTIGFEGSVSGGTTFTLKDGSGTDDNILLKLKNATADAKALNLIGVEHVELNVDGDSRINLQDNDLKSLTVTGKGRLHVAGTAQGPTTIDASHHEGPVSLDFGADDGLTFIGGSGDDHIFAVGTNFTLTGGAGADLFDLFPTGGLAGMTVITDFNPDEDYLSVIVTTEKIAFADTLSAAVRLNIERAETLDVALAKVASETAKDEGAGSTAIFTYHHDTYIYNDFHANGLDPDDAVVKVTGVATTIDPNHLIIARI